MKVWVVIEHVPYECSEIIAVYKSEQAADTKCESLKRKDTRNLYYYNVEEWEVQ